MSDTLRAIVGVLRAPNGTPFANATLNCTRAKRESRAQGASLIVDQPFDVQSNASGEVSFSVVSGRYNIRLRLEDGDRFFTINVPDAAGPHDLSEIAE